MCIFIGHLHTYNIPQRVSLVEHKNIQFKLFVQRSPAVQSSPCSLYLIVYVRTFYPLSQNNMIHFVSAKCLLHYVVMS